MRDFNKIFFSTAAALIFVFIFNTACNKDNGGRLPLPPTNITIQPNSTIYQEINIVGGWMYLTEQNGVDAPKPRYYRLQVFD